MQATHVLESIWRLNKLGGGFVAGLPRPWARFENFAACSGHAYSLSFVFMPFIFCARFLDRLLEAGADPKACDNEDNNALVLLE